MSQVNYNICRDKVNRFLRILKSVFYIICLDRANIHEIRSISERSCNLNTNIESALNVLYQKQITSREHLLFEILRVKMTLKRMEKDSIISNNEQILYQVMKNETEYELGLFSGDCEDFKAVFETLEGIDLIDYTLEIYKNDRMGIIVSPEYLSQYINNRIKAVKPKRILITEAEKHLSGLRQIIKANSDIEFTLTTQYKPMYILLKLEFGDKKNIHIKFESIYSECLLNETFDYIYTLPAFGHKPDELANKFVTNESDGIALENMLKHLNKEGTLDVIVPAKVTFSSGGYERLRTYITDNYNVESIYILPEGIFRPASSIKTYLITISTRQHEGIEIGACELNNNGIEIKDKKTISTKQFLCHDDWRIELLLADDDENIQRFKNSDINKVKLKDVADVFRGKSILKRDTTFGKISVLNISDIEEGDINYSDLDTIDEDEQKVKRYKLETGDVVLSCRGTAIKTAVFEIQDNTIIASANLIVIRPRGKVRGEIIKMFLESPVGLAMIKSFQRGTTVMNINYSDIKEMEIPIIPIEEQEVFIDKYNKEFKVYKDTVRKADKRWSMIKNEIYGKLTGSVK